MEKFASREPDELNNYSITDDQEDILYSNERDFSKIKVIKNSDPEENTTIYMRISLKIHPLKLMYTYIKDGTL